MGFNPVADMMLAQTFLGSIMDHPWRDDKISSYQPTVSTIAWRAVDYDVAHTDFYKMSIVHFVDFHYRQRFLPNIKSYGGSGGNGEGYDTWQEAFDSGVELMKKWQNELDERVQQIRDDNAEIDESVQGVG